jgi:inorganic triphosphatase YgiF
VARDGVEIERTYDLPGGLPDLTAVPGVARVVPLAGERLDALYLDTPGLDLARARTTLRHRTGGRDAGWHLKLPAALGRREVTAPPGGDVPPAGLRALLPDPQAGLVPVVRLRTERALLALHDAAGTVLAEVADDAVTAEALVEPVGTTSWREVEVELVAGGPPLLDAVEEVLRAAGARPAAVPSKLARALAAHLA